MSAITAVRAVLVGAVGVTALVGQKVSPLIKAQGVAPPAVTLRRDLLEPQNDLRGNGSLDKNTVVVDSWATSYAQAVQVAAACRVAMEAAGYQLQSEFDNYEPSIDPSLYNVTQTYLVWT